MPSHAAIQRGAARDGRGRVGALPRAAARLLAALALLLAAAAPAAAHFAEGTKPRTVIVAPGEDGLDAYLRVPAPLLFADAVAAAAARQEPFADPFVRAETLGPAIRHRLSLDAVAADPEGFAWRLAAAHEWRQAGRPVAAQVTGWRILGRDPREGFGSAAEARAAMEKEGARLDPVFGDAVVEIALRLDAPVPDAALAVRSALPPLPLPPGVLIDNHLRDERGAGAARVLEGQLQDWVTLEGSRAAALRGFGAEGARRVLAGLDHALFLVCLGLGAMTGRGLLRRGGAVATGLAPALVVAFLTSAPPAGPLATAVEVAVAATVALAALAAWRRWTGVAWVVAAGAVHGVALALALNRFLAPEGPDAAPSLAAFLLGAGSGAAVVLLAAFGVARAVRLARGQQAADAARTAA